MEVTPVMTMPDFTADTSHYYHTVASAMESLYGTKVVFPRQLTIRVGGLGWKRSRVIAQSPPPGDPLTTATRIVLTVQGTQVFESLPYGMRDADDTDGYPTTKQIMDLFDDPMQKLYHLVDSPSTWFELAEDRPDTCKRFIGLFGLNAEQWPKDLWFSLATFLPTLQEVAGTERGIRHALRLLLDLGVFGLHWRPRKVSIAKADCTTLGENFTRLGVDATLGQCVDDSDALILVIGPVTLEEYDEYRRPGKGTLVRQVLDLVLPFTTATEDDTLHIRWQVGNPHQRPRLGTPRSNSVLGVNSRIGDLAEVALNG